MKRLFFILLAICISGLVLTSFFPKNESDFLRHLRQQFSTQTKVEEKIYIHTDRSFFYPNEDLWFRVSVLNGNTNEYSQLSTVAYVDLIDPQGKKVHTWTLDLDLGIANGDFYFHPELAGGVYKLRAYTVWMKNFGEDVIYEKEITLQKVLKPRLLMKMDFEKRAYSKNDTVSASITIRDAEDKAFNDQKIQFQVRIAGQKWFTDKVVTDTAGKAIISFVLPKELTTTDVLLNVLVPYEGDNESISRAVPVVLNDIKIAFLPESGDYIEDVASKIAFKATNEFGKGADIAGILIDDSGNEITTFESFHLGMGVFEFAAKANRTYTVKLTKPSGIKTIYTLPKPQKTGYLLQLNSLNNQLDVNYYTPTDTEINLVGKVGDKLVYTQTLQAKKGWNRETIDTKKFPIGICQFTLFDVQGEPHAERLTFLNTHKKLNIDIQTEKKQYRPRELVKMNIRTTDENDNPVPTNLSLAVVDDKLFTFADDKQHNLLSWLLLGTDLKGKIEEPEFYFRENEPKAQKALDLLMLTQGWRRFEWKTWNNNPLTYQFDAETKNVIAGRLIDNRSQKGVEGSLWIAIEGQSQMAQVNTDQNGYFAIQNSQTTLSLSCFYASSKINTEYVDLVFSWEDKYSTLENSLITDHETLLPDKIELNTSKKEKNKISIKKVDTDIDFSGRKMKGRSQNAVSVESFNSDISLTNNNLSECVVTAYVAPSKNTITQSLIDGDAQTGSAFISTPTLMSALAGTVTGIQITSANGQTGTSSGIVIRGSSSLSASTQPLLVINGIPTEIHHFSTISPNDIESISVIKGASAIALYGSRGANGVIVMKTKENINIRQKGYFVHKGTLGNYNYRLVEPKYTRLTSKGRTFFLPDYQNEQEVNQRTDFRNTIYWNPFIQTNKDGKASISFYNSDATTVFRAIAEGISIKGQVGRKEATYATTSLFSIDTKIPAYLTFEDKVRIPIFLKNQTTERITGKLTIQSPVQLIPQSETQQLIEIDQKQTKIVWAEFNVANQAGMDTLHISFEGSGFNEKLTQLVQVQPKGFPRAFSMSGNSLKTEAEFVLHDVLEGSLQGKLVAYPDIIGQLMDGIEGIIRQPYGCFEQTSSSTYPNILALQYLQKTNKTNPEIEQKALSYIADGYKRLKGYEVSGTDGFSLFGKPDASTWLSAYGLMEFIDMKTVYSGVDNSLIQRTVNFLLSKRDGKGGFLEKTYTYSSSESPTSAYVVYALAGLNKFDIQKEYQATFKQALISTNFYQKALLFNASTKLGKTENAKQLLEQLNPFIDNIENFDGHMLRSITYGYGNSVKIETASLIVMAMLKMPDIDVQKINQLMKFILQARKQGTFGSTQATILALKSIIAYTEFTSEEVKNGKLHFAVNQQEMESKTYQKTSTEVYFQNLATTIGEGTNHLKVYFSETDRAIPFSLNFEWYTRTPEASPDCEVDLQTTLLQNKVQVGETARLTTIIKNKTSQGLPSVVALVGIPSGLSPQAWQLKKLVDEKVIDFYEFKDNFVVLYYVDMEKNAQKTIHLDLKAEVAGSYQAPASSAYLYYADEWKDWEAGTQIEIY